MQYAQSLIFGDPFLLHLIHKVIFYLGVPLSEDYRSRQPFLLLVSTGGCAVNDKGAVLNALLRLPSPANGHSLATAAGMFSMVHPPALSAPPPAPILPGTDCTAYSISHGLIFIHTHSGPTPPFPPTATRGPAWALSSPRAPTSLDLTIKAHLKILSREWL